MLRCLRNAKIQRTFFDAINAISSLVVKHGVFVDREKPLFTTWQVDRQNAICFCCFSMLAFSFCDGFESFESGRLFIAFGCLIGQCNGVAVIGSIAFMYICVCYRSWSISGCQTKCQIRLMLCPFPHFGLPFAMHWGALIVSGIYFLNLANGLAKAT